MKCEGYRRSGGVFTFGPVKWVQCENTATVKIKFKQRDEPIDTLPACNDCWQECIKGKNVNILSVTPITSGKRAKN